MQGAVGQDSVIIRPLCRGDAGLLEAFFQSLGAQSRAWFHPHPFDAETAERLVSEVGNHSEARYLMVRRVNGHEDIVGYGFLFHLAADMPELGIAIADHVQGNGLGQRMMQHLIEVGRQMGKRGLKLTVYDDNRGARHVYEKCGFVTRRLVHHMEFLFDKRSI